MLVALRGAPALALGKSIREMQVAESDKGHVLAGKQLETAFNTVAALKQYRLCSPACTPASEAIERIGKLLYQPVLLSGSPASGSPSFGEPQSAQEISHLPTWDKDAPLAYLRHASVMPPMDFCTLQEKPTGDGSGTVNCTIAVGHMLSTFGAQNAAPDCVVVAVVQVVPASELEKVQVDVKAITSTSQSVFLVVVPASSVLSNCVGFPDLQVLRLDSLRPQRFPLESAVIFTNDMATINLLVNAMVDDLFTQSSVTGKGNGAYIPQKKVIDEREKLQFLAHIDLQGITLKEREKEARELNTIIATLQEEVGRLNRQVERMHDAIEDDNDAGVEGEGFADAFVEDASNPKKRAAAQTIPGRKKSDNKGEESTPASTSATSSSTKRHRYMRDGDRLTQENRARAAEAVTIAMQHGKPAKPPKRKQ